MAETAPSRKWVMRGVFAMLSLALLFAQLLPLETSPRRWAGPDFMVVLTLVWALRKPEYVPSWLVAIVFLLADFLLLRPPGLAAAIVLLVSEVQRNRSFRLREATFAYEWLTASGFMLVIAVSYRVIASLMLLPVPPLGLMLMQVIMNIAIYPVIVVLSHFLFGVRRSTAPDGGLGAN
ncbi:rod shape-determining protein MreD [Shimia sp. MMG029]|uniref:rod shape-determining protein MreD n=1 Tax=Shimia sp. MMG029 TaxID=3021978 RepID=UPI0022FF0E19|nr:rod shape-determining protein MreD [Shimia sp. MMG029]MDA5558435.1 rod shape-determining protein MreD [Shimia sp. MMG029]